MLLRGVAVVRSAAASVQRAGSSDADQVTIATGSTSGVYFPLGTSLAEIYSARVPGVIGEAIQTGASPANVHALQPGTADIAFALGDTAYIAYTEGTRLNPSPHRRAARDRRALHQRLALLRDARQPHPQPARPRPGRRLAFGVATVAGGRSRTVDLLLQGHGVDPRPSLSTPAQFDDIIAGLRAKTIDVGVISAGFPVPAIEAAARAGLRFLDVDPLAVERVREQYPFFLPLTIPPGTYSSQAAPIETVGVDNVLLCREDLDEALVYRLTKTFFDALPDLAATHPSAGLIDADLAPATAIPLHSGAARYYRERELLLY